VDNTYEAYCIADPLFYDAPTRREGGLRPFPAGRRSTPKGWVRQDNADWQSYTPVDRELAAQGWKIHISGCDESAAEIVEAAWDYCVPRRIPFKFLRGRQVLFIRNSKYADRGSSGKLVTIYPSDDGECELILKELGGILDGAAGPYILSDLRIGEGPLYVRYGGFTERFCTGDRGELVPAIENAEGELVPDRRGPVFAVPEWVTPPGFLAPHIEARGRVTVGELPYRIEKALHFSNGGGVYRARHTGTGAPVVLKEARPYAGLDVAGADAVTRLEREHAMLTRLDGLDCVPGVHDLFTLGDHRFLVQDFIEGDTLNTFFAYRHPLLAPETDPAAVRTYTDWALRVHAGIEDAVRRIHERGVVVNDLHMFNVMVRPDDTVALIDFEVAALVEEARRPTLANPGFLAPRDRQGFAIDRYSLACLKLALFMPLTTLFTLDRGKAADLAGAIAENFPVPDGYLDDAVAEIASGPTASTARISGTGGPPRPAPDTGGWLRARASLAHGIAASATPERDDRLFPGDIRTFGSGGLGLAYGAAGVLYALERTGAGRFPRFEDWLVRHAAEPPHGSGLGLYDGLCGTAYVLDHLGYRDEALRLAGMLLTEKWERLGSDLLGGLPGIAWTLSWLARRTGETEPAAAAARMVDIVTDRLRHPPAADPGLLHGATGTALMCVRAYEAAPDPALLDHAATALRQDLDRCVLDDNGALHVDLGSRVLPYLGRGSTGVGVGLGAYLAHRTDERFAEARAAIRRAALSPYFAQSGLFAGRAGMVYYLARDLPPGTATADPRVAAQIRNLNWHALAYRGHLAFPGDNLYRLSMDLGTGSAGVLLALGVAQYARHDGRPIRLPLLDADPAIQAPPAPGRG